MLQRDSIDLHAAARAGILFLFGAHAAGGANFDTSAYNTFTTALSHNKTSCQPKCPPSDRAVRSMDYHNYTQSQLHIGLSQLCIESSSMSRTVSPMRVHRCGMMWWAVVCGATR